MHPSAWFARLRAAHGRRPGLVAAAVVLGIAAAAVVLSCADFGSPFVPDVASVAISGAPRRSLRTGETLDLVADVRDAAGRPVTGAAVEWTSSAPGTAVAESRGALVGRARATAVGSAMIVARAGRIQSSAMELSVLPRDAASVTITSPSSPMTLGIGQSAQFTAEVRDSGGALLQDPPLAWVSSSPGVIRIDAGGLAQALAPGNATIQAQSNAVLSAGVAVSVPPPAPSYAAVIQPIWNANCTSCHGSDGGLSLSGNAYDRIVNVASTQNRNFKRVLPGDPDNSYILRKLEGCSTAGCIGGSMPPGLRLSSTQLQQIRAWIQGNCPR